MPPIIGTDDEQQGIDPNQQTHGAGIYTPPTAGGSSGFVGGGGGQGATTQTAQAQTPTSAGPNYTNLLSYIGANQGSGATMGGAARDIVNGVGAQTKADTDTYKTSGAQAAQSGTVSVDPAKMAQINSGVTEGATSNKINPDGSVTTNKAATTYTGPNPTVSYGGPSDSAHQTGQALSDQKNAYGDLTRLAGYGANAAGGTAGNAALLGGPAGIYNQPSYTGGERNLDSAILGGTAGGQQALKDIGGAAAAGAQQGKDADASVDAADSAGAATTKATQTSYDQAVTKAKQREAGPSSTTTAPLPLAMRAPTTTPVAAPAAPTPPPTPAPPPYTGGGVQYQKGQGFSPPPAPAPGAYTGGGVQYQKGQGFSPPPAQAAPAYGGYQWKKYADGGEVDGDDDDKGGGGAASLLQTAGKLAPLLMMALKSGGKVPGKPNFPGKNTIKNDTVHALVTPGEVVMPLTVTQAPDAPQKAKEFMQDVQKKNDDDSPYGGLLKMAGG